MKTLKKIMALAIGTIISCSLVFITGIDSKAAPNSEDGNGIGYGITSDGVNIYGIDADGDKIQTTYHNYGYMTAVSVNGGSIYWLGDDVNFEWGHNALGTFSNGKVYTVDGVEVSVTVSLGSTKDYAVLNYLIKNTTSEAKTVKIGTFGDTEIDGYDDDCLLSIKNGRIYLSDPYGENGFCFATNQGSFTTTYIGEYDDCHDYIFSNSAVTEDDDSDSGIAFSWTLNVPAGATVNKAAFTAVGDVNIIDDIIDDATTVKEDGDWLDPLRTQLHIAADPEFGANVNNTADYTGDFALPVEIMQYIKDNPQVTLNYSFYVDDVLRTVTITGKNVVVEEGVLYYGFNYLLSHYGDGSAVTGPTGIYTIVKGDTLTSIAKKFGTTIEALAAKNGIKNVDLIYAGAKIAY